MLRAKRCLYRISEEREKLEKEWLAERDLINEEYQTKIDGLNKTIDDSESQIKVLIVGKGQQTFRAKVSKISHPENDTVFFVGKEISITMI